MTAFSLYFQTISTKRLTLLFFSRHHKINDDTLNDEKQHEHHENRKLIDHKFHVHTSFPRPHASYAISHK